MVVGFTMTLSRLKMNLGQIYLKDLPVLVELKVMKLWLGLNISTSLLGYH